jgi:polysaccharide pyruvyl transferase WcaK-like protein
VRTSLGRAEAITTRDRKSFDRLIDLGIEKSRLVLAADPVFRVERASRQAGRTFLDQLLGGIGADETVILFAPANDHTIGQSHLPALIHGVKRAAAQIGARVLLKPMDQQERFDLALLARKDLQPDGIVTQLPPEAFSEERLKLLFAGVDLTVSSRMHALILSATQGTPWINIARGSKMIAMAETFNTAHLDVNNLVEQDVVDAMTESLSTSREHWQSRQDPVLQDLANTSSKSLQSFEMMVRSGASHGLENQPPDG